MAPRNRIIAGTYTEADRRYRVELVAEVSPAQLRATGQTTNHEPIPADAVELSISADIYAATADGSRDLRYSDAVGGGQSVDDLRKVIDHGRAITSRETLRAILSAWEAYHLNGMQAGCAHQGEAWTCTFDANAATRETARRIGGDPESVPPAICGTLNGWAAIRAQFGEHPYPHRGDECYECGRNRWDEPSDACPVSGYRFGTAWLYATVPADVLAKVRAAFGMPEAVPA